MFKRMPKSGETWKHKTQAHDVMVMDAAPLGPVVQGKGLIVRYMGPADGDTGEMDLIEFLKNYDPPIRSEETLAKAMLYKAFEEINFDYEQLTEDFQKLITREEFSRLLPWSIPRD